MTDIRNTTEDMKDGAGALILLRAGTGDSGAGAEIEQMEAQGQRQLVASDKLPTDMRGEQVGFEDLGFTFGDPVPGDPMFRTATLPPGWKRQPSDHSMWSYLVDDLGRRRVSIFYKAAFYDRSASMRLDTPAGYLRDVVYADGRPVLDDTWLTPAVVAETLGELRQESLNDAANALTYLAREDTDSGYWHGREREHRETVERIDAMLAALPAAPVTVDPEVPA